MGGICPASPPQEPPPRRQRRDEQRLTKGNEYSKRPPSKGRPKNEYYNAIYSNPNTYITREQYTRIVPHDVHQTILREEAEAPDSRLTNDQRMVTRAVDMIIGQSGLTTEQLEQLQEQFPDVFEDWAMGYTWGRAFIQQQQQRQLNNN